MTRVITSFSAFAIAAGMAVTGPGRALLSSAAPSLRDVLSRTAEYCAAYGDALASVVADEDFLQELVLRRDGTVLERRRLESEIAFVKLAGSADWLAFRSVVRVDGVAVPDAAGQLQRVFRDTPSSALSQARAIAAASARHNLGPVQRNFNVPTTVLQFMLKQHQDRFRFRKIADERVGGESVWVIEFRERDRGTFIRTPAGRDAPAHGRLWIVPDDGRVVRSRLDVKADVHAGIDAVWRHDERLGLWVPSEMRERYGGGLKSVAGVPEAHDVHGLARYSNYRRFDVDFRIIR